MENTNQVLKDCFESILRLEEEKLNLSEAIKDIYKRLGDDGFDVKAMKKIVADHKKEIKSLLEVEDMISFYREVLGIVSKEK